MLRKRFTPRDQYLIVRLTPKEKEKIQKDAEKQKLTTSEYVRRLAESPQKLTLQDIRHTLIDCKFLALGVRDTINNVIVMTSPDPMTQELKEVIKSVREIERKTMEILRDT